MIGGIPADDPSADSLPSTQVTSVQEEEDAQVSIATTNDEETLAPPRRYSTDTAIPANQQLPATSLWKTLQQSNTVDLSSSSDDEEAASNCAVHHYDSTKRSTRDYAYPIKDDTTSTTPPRKRKYTILGLAAILLIAAVTGVTLVIFFKQSNAGSVGGTNNNSTGIGDNNTTSDDTNTTSDGNETDDTNGVNSNETNVGNETHDGDSSCQSMEDANREWNAIRRPWNFNLLSGPMVGHTTPTSTILWAYHNASTPLSIAYQRLGSCPTKVQRATFPTNKTKVELTGLEPNTQYRFHVLLENTKIGQEGTFTTFPFHQHKFRYMFGSCISFKRDATQEIWYNVSNQNPEFLILNGDTVYSNTVNYTEHWEYHLIQRNIEPFANIIRRLPVYATWYVPEHALLSHSIFVL